MAAVASRQGVRLRIAPFIFSMNNSQLQGIYGMPCSCWQKAICKNIIISKLEPYTRARKNSGCVGQRQCQRNLNF